MKHVNTKQEIEAARAANPNDKIMWRRPDGFVEIHHPHGKGVSICPPKSGFYFPPIEEEPV